MACWIARSSVRGAVVAGAAGATGAAGTATGAGRTDGSRLKRRSMASHTRSSALALGVLVAMVSPATGRWW
jgi:hypothetical protein